MAAVNDITSREKHFQLQNKLDRIEDNKMNTSLYQENCKSIEGQISEHCFATTPFPQKSLSSVESSSLRTSAKVCSRSSYDHTRNSCASPDEYVDINDMEFIEAHNEHGTEKENMLMRRSYRRRAVKRSDECKLRRESATKTFHVNFMV